MKYKLVPTRGRVINAAEYAHAEGAAVWSCYVTTPRQTDTGTGVSYRTSGATLRKQKSIPLVTILQEPLKHAVHVWLCIYLYMQNPSSAGVFQSMETVIYSHPALHLIPLVTFGSWITGILYVK